MKEKESEPTPPIEEVEEITEDQEQPVRNELNLHEFLSEEDEAVEEEEEHPVVPEGKVVLAGVPSSVEQVNVPGSSLTEAFGILISARTDPGDLVRLKIIWSPGEKKPRLLAEFCSTARGKKPGWVEFTKLLPEKSGRIDPISGVWQGFRSWRDALLHRTEGYAVFMEGMIRRAGRRVLVVEERAT